MLIGTCVWAEIVDWRASLSLPHRRRAAFVIEDSHSCFPEHPVPLQLLSLCKVLRGKLIYFLSMSLSPSTVCVSLVSTERKAWDKNLGVGDLSKKGSQRAGIRKWRKVNKGKDEKSLWRHVIEVVTVGNGGWWSVQHASQNCQPEALNAEAFIRSLSLIPLWLRTAPSSISLLP